MNSDCGCIKKVVDKVYIENSCCGKKETTSNCSKNYSCKSCGKQIDLIDSDLYAENIYNYTGDNSFNTSDFGNRTPDPISREKVYNQLVETDNKTEILIQLMTTQGFYGLKSVAIAKRQGNKYILVYVKQYPDDSKEIPDKTDGKPIVSKDICIYTNDGNETTYEVVDGLTFNCDEILEILKKYYTKAEIDYNFYNKTEIDYNFYNKNQVYNKTEIENLLNNYYTKTYINNNYYNKDQVDDLILFENNDTAQPDLISSTTQRKGDSSVSTGKYSFAMQGGLADGKRSVYIGYAPQGQNDTKGAHGENTISIGNENELTSSSSHSFTLGSSLTIGKYFSIDSSEWKTPNTSNSLTFGTSNYVSGSCSLASGTRNYIKDSAASNIFGWYNSITGGHYDFAFGFGNQVNGNANISGGLFSRVLKASSDTPIGSVSIGKPFSIQELYLKETGEVKEGTNYKYYNIYYGDPKTILRSSNTLTNKISSSNTILGNGTKKILAEVVFDMYNSSGSKKQPYIKEIDVSGENVKILLDTNADNCNVQSPLSGGYYPITLYLSKYSNISMGQGCVSFGVGNSSAGTGATTFGVYNVNNSNNGALVCGIYSKDPTNDYESPLFCIGKGTYNSTAQKIIRENIFEVTKGTNGGIYFIVNEEGNLKRYSIKDIIDSIKELQQDFYSTIKLNGVDYSTTEEKIVENSNSYQSNYYEHPVEIPTDNNESFYILNDFSVYDPYNRIPEDEDFDLTI